MHRFSIALALLTSSAMATAGAQTAPVAPGVRIRVTTTADSGERVIHQIGVLQSVTGDTVRYLRGRDSTPSMALLGPRVRLEHSTGFAAHPGLGLFIGGTLGALSVVGKPRGDDGGLASAAGVFSGAVIGFLVGAAIHTDKWEPVSAEGVAVRLSANGAGIAIRLRRADAPPRWLSSTGRLSYQPN